MGLVTVEGAGEIGNAPPVVDAGCVEEDGGGCGMWKVGTNQSQPINT